MQCVHVDEQSPHVGSLQTWHVVVGMQALHAVRSQSPQTLSSQNTLPHPLCSSSQVTAQSSQTLPLQPEHFPAMQRVHKNCSHVVHDPISMQSLHSKRSQPSQSKGEEQAGPSQVTLLHFSQM